jgi:heme/copper-type cytochrome/quinol oxidase subunit 2
MFDSGRVVSKTAFASWIKQQQSQNSAATKSLDPYSKTYFPDPQRRGG